MGVVWKEECAEKQRSVIERIFQAYRERGEASPRVQLFRREVSGKRAARELNARAQPLALVIGPPRPNDRPRVVEIVTPSGQTFPYAMTDEEKLEADELEA